MPNFLSHILQDKDAIASQLLSTLSLEEKIAALIHIPAWSYRGQAHLEELERTISQYKVGGIIFFQGDPETQARWTKHLQGISQRPLLVGFDGEWGLGMRLNQSPIFPYAMTMGAMRESHLVYEMGKEVARQLQQIGVHINYAPVVDINTNPKNPVIGFRSFGSDIQNVIDKAWAYASGMEDQGVMAVFKHFPGHGDTSTDSHLTLPVLKHNEERLQQVELAPYKELIQRGASSIMSTHIHIPVWDDATNRAATHSPTIITDILQKQLGFQGMVFTDALDMKGVSGFAGPAEINAKALLAGHDVLLFCVDVPGTIEAVVSEVEKGNISETEIERRFLKTFNLQRYFSENPHQQGAWEKEQAFEQTSKIILPMAEQSVSWWKKSSSSAAMEERTCFVVDMKNKRRDELKHHQLTFKGGKEYDRGALFTQKLGDQGIPSQWLRVEDKKWVDPIDKPSIVMVQGLEVKAKDKFGMDERLLDWIDQQLASGNCQLVWMASPYGLSFLKNINQAEAVLLTYQEGEEFEQVAVDVLLGKREGVGHLPV
ncbi:MAG: glycoside hydrolase family 3 N-terminal domain-containing protein [Bacteroidota bacterium]